MKFKPARLILPRLLFLGCCVPLCTLRPPHHLCFLHLTCLSPGKQSKWQIFQEQGYMHLCFFKINLSLDTCSAKWCRQV